MKNKRAQDILAENGCRVSGEYVWIPKTLVQRCLKTVPETVIICNRNGEQVLELNSRNGRSYFVPGDVYCIQT